MDVLQQVGQGFLLALTPQNLLFCFIGVLVGTLIGVLPGIGPVSGVAILLPLTFSLDPTGGMIMLAGIYYGSMYGGSTTSILINTPGESASVMTCLDGYAMARQGRAGPALGMCAIASFVAGTFSVLGLMLLAPPLASFALRFGPAEYFALMVLGLTTLTRLAGKSLTKGLMMGAFGLALGTVGLDPLTGTPRFTFGRIELIDGIGFVPVAMGLFALAEIFANAEESLTREVFKTDLKNLWPTAQDWLAVRWTLVRATIIGFFIGALPGAGATVAAFMAYAVEKKSSKYPERFGTGVIEGVAAPEAANNAATGGALVPLLTLGLPSSATTAVMLGALLIFGLRPGPLLMIEQPDFFWAVVTSMYVGNVMLLVLNLPLVGLWASMLRIPYTILLPLIILFTLIGAYALNNNVSDIWIMIAFGVVGYLMRKFEYPAAPVVLALVLGPLMETNFRRALTISQGDYSVFLTHPISAVLLLAAVLSLTWPLLMQLFGRSSEMPVPVAEEV
ncbi:MAG: tripartite tricarboxylate transporter permease [Chloroflexi bacterium]|nr:tripartite tricarboxylate transporter permease [Chloroflexota bacterium]